MTERPPRQSLPREMGVHGSAERQAGGCVLDAYSNEDLYRMWPSFWPPAANDSLAAQSLSGRVDSATQSEAWVCATLECFGILFRAITEWRPYLLGARCLCYRPSLAILAHELESPDRLEGLEVGRGPPGLQHYNLPIEITPGAKHVVLIACHSTRYGRYPNMKLRCRLAWPGPYL